MSKNVFDQVRNHVQRLTAPVLDKSNAENPGSDLFEADDDADDRDFQEDAAIVSNAIIDLFEPENVIQIGCGIGLHLKPFVDADIDVKGLDESKVALENPAIPKKHIQIMPLNTPYSPENTYDVALCIDMLEYTSPQGEDAIIASVANAGKTAVVSAPLPRYDSLHYDHEEPKQYWIKKFQDYGMNYDSDATRNLQDRIDTEEAAWIPEQLLVFQKN